MWFVQKSTINTDADPLRVRDAGLLERMYALRYDHGVGSCVIVSATYANKTSSLDRTTLYAALKSVLIEQPILCVQLSSKASAEPYWVRMPSINLDEFVTFSSTSENYESILVAELSKPNRDCGRGLWRLTVLEDNTVIFACDHTIGDGRSGLAFHRSLLRALNSHSALDVLNAGSIVTTPTDLALEKSVDAALDAPTPYGELLRRFLENFILPRTWLPATTTWTGHSAASVPHQRVNARLHTISSPDAKALVVLSRMNNCTLTGFLRTLAVYILSHIVHDLNASEEEGQKYKALSLSLAVDLRSFTGCPDSTIITQASGISFYAPLLDPSVTYPPTKTSFPWFDSAVFCTAVRERREEAKGSIGILKFAFRSRNPAKFIVHELLGRKREHTIRLSNVGRFSPEVGGSSAKSEPQAWSIEDLVFCGCDAASGPALTICAVGTPTGKVNIMYTWGAGGVDSDLADAFVAGMKEGIQSILTT